MKKRKLLLYGIGGALVLCVFSALQKALLGGPYTLKSYALPVIWGSGTGLLVAWLESKASHTRFKLACREAELESIVQASPLGIGMVKKRIICQVTDYFCEMVGYERDELLGRLARMIYPSDEEFERVAHVKRGQFEETGTGTVETRFKRKDGSIIHVLLRSTPLDKNDWNEGIVFTALDITQRKEMELHLEESLKELEKGKESFRKAHEAEKQANAAKSEFLTNMSHELRTPINGILGMLQLIMETPLTEDQQEYAEHALKSGDRLTSLLSDILDISKIDSGRIKVVENMFVLQNVLCSVQSLFASAVEQAGLTWTMDISPDIPEILVGDSRRFQQILNNLVENAIKFTTKGEITLEAYPLPSTSADQIRILFSVSDTGIGIDDMFLDALFYSFTQADSGYARKYQGAGLGLALVKKLVTLLDGNISVASNKGVGTSIQFCLPFKRADEFTLSTLTEEAPAILAEVRMNVLVVEDDVTNQVTFAKMLEARNCTAMIACNGEQAIEILAQEKFDMVFMDIQMPDMDGLTATIAIRSGKAGVRNKSIPIIAISAFAMEGDEHMFKEAGVSELLTKPVTIDAVHEVISRFSAYDATCS